MVDDLSRIKTRFDAHSKKRADVCRPALSNRASGGWGAEDERGSGRLASSSLKSREGNCP